MSDNLDLILHIGFPKCASTTLQNNVFKYQGGYLGTHKGLPKAKNWAKQFQALSPVGPSLWTNRKRAIAWSKEVNTFWGGNFPDVDRLILSSELLTNRNTLKDRPVIDFLQWFKNNVWQEGDIKVLLILRNPADRLTSSYAQASASNPRANQKDFEKYIERKLKLRNQMGYANWVSDLYQKIGKDNVCVLLMEEISELAFWQQLKDFCELKRLDPEDWLSRSFTKNSRKQSKDTWQVQPYSPERNAHTFCLNWFGFLWPQFICNKGRVQAFNRCKEIMIYRYEFLRSDSNRAPGYIQLTSSLRQKIQENYRKDTAKLSHLLNQNLDLLGY